MKRIVPACLSLIVCGCAYSGIDFDDAKKIAQEEIDKKSPGMHYTYAPERIVEKDYGWLFVEVSSEYLISNDGRYQIIGVGPLAVDRLGQVYFVPLSVSWFGGTDEYVKQQMLERSKQK